jgi:NADH-quinone oxidoreductase subunit M
MGGFWAVAPRLSGVGLVFALASLGFPGFGNFVAEFMVLLGSYRVNVAITVIAATGLVFSAIYSLWIVQRAFHGAYKGGVQFPDTSVRETGMMAVLIVAIFWIGLHPQPFLNASRPALEGIGHAISSVRTTERGEMQ